MTLEERIRNARSFLATQNNLKAWARLTTEERAEKMAKIAQKSAWKRKAVANIRKYWQNRGMTLPGLAQKMGVSLEWLVSFDRYREPLTNDVIKQFGDAFDKTPREMLEMIEGVDKLD